MNTCDIALTMIANDNVVLIMLTDPFTIDKLERLVVTCD